MKKTSIRKISEFMALPAGVDSPVMFDENEPEVIQADDNNVVDHVIREVTPMTLTTNNINGTDIATLFYLCKNDDEMFILFHNYIMENQEDISLVKMNALHDSQNFLSKMVAANMVIKYLDNYNTDLCFYRDKELDVYTLYGIVNPDDNVIHRFIMNTDVFSSMAYIDDAVCGAVFDEHDINVATTVGACPLDITSTFVVDGIDSIVSLAMVDKDTNTLAVIFKPLRYSKDGAEIIKVLMPVCVEEKFNKKKFNTTLDEIGKTYTNDADQYVLNYMFDVRVCGDDKDYLALRVNNSAGVYKLLLLDTDIQVKLGEMISKF